MKTVNLLPRSIIERIEINRFIIRYTAAAAVIFLLFVLLVLSMDMSAGIISGEIETLSLIMLDEKFEESDRVAAETIERLAEIERQVRPDEIMVIEQIDLDIVALLGDIMLNIQNGERFICMENIIYDNTETIEIIGISSERELISNLVRKLCDEKIFQRIDVPEVSQDRNETYKFKLILTTAGV